EETAVEKYGLPINHEKRNRLIIMPRDKGRCTLNGHNDHSDHRGNHNEHRYSWSFYPVGGKGAYLNHHYGDQGHVKPTSLIKG
ncbi:hypothetical protein EG408_RS27170, partial [Escherichia coli]